MLKINSSPSVFSFSLKEKEFGQQVAVHCSDLTREERSVEICHRGWEAGLKVKRAGIPLFSRRSDPPNPPTEPWVWARCYETLLLKRHEIPKAVTNHM